MFVSTNTPNLATDWNYLYKRNRCFQFWSYTSIWH